MSEIDWFIVGVVIGVILDIPIVKILLRPVYKRLSKLEALTGGKNE